ncbi:MAG: FmdB family zinc ribbon protein [Burkholderiales bacterium]
MPLYEYRCTKCNHVFEVHHEVGASPGPCPVCGGTPRRIFTSVGLIFKGSGFYTTDNRKPGAVDGASGKEPTGKESARKEPAGPGTGGKDSGGKDSGGKDSAAKDSGASGQSTEAAAKGM